jgi:hypothetical protein
MIYDREKAAPFNFSNIQTGRVVRINVLFIVSIICTCTMEMSECGYDSGYQKGMTIFFKPPRNRFQKDDFVKNANKLKSLGVNTLFLTPYYSTPDPCSDQIDSSELTIPDSQLCRAVEIALEAGIEVILKPHIDCRGGQPRYTIEPHNYDVWMEQYKGFINKYLSITRKYNLQSFVIATELDNIIQSNQFIEFCDSIRSADDIRIIISASYNHFASSKIWKHADVIGVNAYLNFDNSEKPLESTLYETWNYWLNTITQLSEINGKPVILTEVGFMSRSNAAQNPGDFSGNYAIDYNVQDMCYRSLLAQACKFSAIKGIFFWQWELGTSGSNTDGDYTPEGKPAENTIKRYWAQ